MQKHLSDLIHFQLLVKIKYNCDGAILIKFKHFNMKSSSEKQSNGPETPPKRTRPSQSNRDAIRLNSSTGIKMRENTGRKSIITRIHRATINAVSGKKRQEPNQTLPVDDSEQQKQKELNQQLKELQQAQNNQWKRIDYLIQGFRMYKQGVQKYRKKKKQYLEESYHAVSRVRQNKSDLCDEKLNDVHLRQNLEKNYTQIQKQLYSRVSHQDELQNKIKQSELRVQKIAIEIDQSQQNLKQAKERFQYHYEEEDILKEEFKQVAAQMDKTLVNKEQRDLHSSILKIQFNPYIRLGFITQPQTSVIKNDALGKERWPSQKQIRLSIQEIKHFIILQLYYGWKKMIKISYKSSHYAILLGYKYDENLNQNIKRAVIPPETKSLSKKKTKMIVFFCQKPTRKDQFKLELVKSLRNFDSQLIRIQGLEFVETKDQTESLEITYSYLNSMILRQSFFFKFRDSISREQIQRTISDSEKRLICLIQIPMFCSKEQNKIYSQVYDMLKKNKKLC